MTQQLNHRPGGFPISIPSLVQRICSTLHKCPSLQESWACSLIFPNLSPIYLLQGSVMKDESLLEHVDKNSPYFSFADGLWAWGQNRLWALEGEAVFVLLLYTMPTIRHWFLLSASTGATGFAKKGTIYYRTEKKLLLWKKKCNSVTQVSKYVADIDAERFASKTVLSQPVHITKLALSGHTEPSQWKTILKVLSPKSM